MVCKDDGCIDVKLAITYASESLWWDDWDGYCAKWEGTEMIWLSTGGDLYIYLEKRYLVKLNFFMECSIVVGVEWNVVFSTWLKLIVKYIMVQKVGSWNMLDWSNKVLLSSWREDGLKAFCWLLYSFFMKINCLGSRFVSKWSFCKDCWLH